MRKIFILISLISFSSIAYSQNSMKETGDYEQCKLCDSNTHCWQYCGNDGVACSDEDQARFALAQRMPSLKNDEIELLSLEEINGINKFLDNNGDEIAVEIFVDTKKTRVNRPK